MNFARLAKAAIAAATVSLSAAASAQTADWKLQSFVTPGTNQWDGYLLPFVEALKQKSGGRFTLTVFPAGAIAKNEDLTKAVGAGVIEAAHGTATLDAGALPPAYVLAGLPFSFATPAQQLEFWYDYQGGAAFKALNEAYNRQGVQVVAIVSVSAPLVMQLNFPVAKVGDFQGKKIRAAPSFGESIKALGAQQVNLPLGEVYTGMQTGLIDGTLLTIPALDDYKIKELAKSVVEAPAFLAVSEGDIKVNLAAWNRLPEDLRRAFTEAARETNVRAFVPYSEALTKKVRDGAVAAGVKFVNLVGDDAAKYAAATESTWKFAEGLSPQNAQLVKSLKDYLKAKGVVFPGG